MSEEFWLTISLEAVFMIVLGVFVWIGGKK